MHWLVYSKGPRAPRCGTARDALDAEHVANAVAARLRLHKLDHGVVALVLVGLNTWEVVEAARLYEGPCLWSAPLNQRPRVDILVASTPVRTAPEARLAQVELAVGDHQRAVADAVDRAGLAQLAGLVLVHRCGDRGKRDQVHASERSRQRSAPLADRGARRRQRSVHSCETSSFSIMVMKRMIGGSSRQKCRNCSRVMTSGSCGASPFCAPARIDAKKSWPGTNTNDARGRRACQHESAKNRGGAFSTAARVPARGWTASGASWLSCSGIPGARPSARAHGRIKCKIAWLVQYARPNS